MNDQSPMLEDHALVRRASLDEIKSMLTYCVRATIPVT
jgi:hypothetical protein